MSDERIVAIGLLTEDDLRRLGDTFTRIWPVDRSTDFTELLRAIDEAEERFHQEIRPQMR
ncbi:MAG TPA: hypothetical protein VGD23_06075 [Sphingomicrobium sp.]